MSPQDQAMLEQAKKSLLSAGKQAKKEKDAAKAEYEKNKDMGIVSDDESLTQWCNQNYPSLQAVYSNYSANEAQYTQALLRCDASAAKEWQKGNQDAYAKLHAPEDSFERTYLIRLPEE